MKSKILTKQKSRRIININKRHNLWQEIKKHKESYLLMLPFMILFFLLIVIPVIVAICLSFTYFNMLEAPRWIGLLNYQKLFLDDDIFLLAIKNTLIFAFLTGPLSYMLCLIFAWLINELPKKLRVLMTFIFYAPSISGNAYLVWQFMFSGDEYGLINGLLMKMGVLREPVLWLSNQDTALNIVILVQLWLSLGVSFLSFIAGLQSIDKSLYEAAAVDGVKNRIQNLWYITLPSMKPQLLFGAVMQINMSFAVSGVAMSLAGFPSKGYVTRTIVTHIIDYGTIKYEMGYASAIAVILFIIMIVTKKLIESLINNVG